MCWARGFWGARGWAGLALGRPPTRSPVPSPGRPGQGGRAGTKLARPCHWVGGQWCPLLTGRRPDTKWRGAEAAISRRPRETKAAGTGGGGGGPRLQGAVSTLQAATCPGERGASWALGYPGLGCRLRGGLVLGSLTDELTFPNPPIPGQVTRLPKSSPGPGSAAGPPAGRDGSPFLGGFGMSHILQDTR